MEKIPAIILAAGLSSRMGAFKPLLPLAGATLLDHGITALRSRGAISDIILVVGHRGEEIRTAVQARPDLRIVENPLYAQGEMLSSVQCGIRALAAESTGFLLALADQPAGAPATIQSLVNRFRTHHAPLTLPTFAGKRGHPVVFSTVLSAEILALAAPDTLKTLVHRHLPQAELVEVPDPSIHEDLDTPEDFARAARKYPPAPGR
ncbi:MAG TPA: nucleotidyltransferase family protein [Phycisphaerae bacterium]|nr:nucleotidyltransferase family protein [Phycisphaerae bacterium]